MMDLYLIFQFFQGRCHGNQLMLRKCCQRRLIPLSFVALVLENELQYHGLAVLVNSGDNGVTSSNNVVNFCLVTPEMTGLICVSLVWHGPKLAHIVEYLQIYWTDFRNLFTTWKRFTCQWWICTLFSNLSRDVAMECCHNEGKLVLRAFFARLPDVSTVLVRYYLVGGDTAAPSGLYARLCHAFLVYFFYLIINDKGHKQPLTCR